MTQLLVGTKKGLFVLEGDAGSTFEVTSRAFAGEPVEFATRDPRSGRFLACVTSAFYGPKVFYTDDLAGEWEQAAGVELPEDAEKPLERLWTVVPAEDDGHLYAGGAPGVLFESHDGGATWELNKAFWEQPTRPEWSPGAGGMCMHSIATWPGDPSRVALAISAVGVWLTDDGGADVAPREQGHVPALHARGGPRGDDHALRPQHAPRAEAAGAALHAVPRRRLPLGRRGRELDEHRRRAPVRLRVPDGRRPGRPGQRVRHPARRGHGPRDARRAACASTRRATRARAGPSAATASRRRTRTSRSSARRSAARARVRRWASTSARRRATSSARGDAGQDVVHGGDEAAAGALRARRVGRVIARTAAAKRPRFRDLRATGIRTRGFRSCAQFSRDRAPRSRSGRCAPIRASRPRGATRTSPSPCTSSRGGRSGRSRRPRRESPCP